MKAEGLVQKLLTLCSILFTKRGEWFISTASKFSFTVTYSLLFNADVAIKPWLRLGA